MDSRTRHLSVRAGPADPARHILLVRSHVNLEDRVLYVNDRLSDQCLEIGVIPMVLRLDEWPTAPLKDPSNLHKPYGWVPPYVGDPDDHHDVDCICGACATGEDPEMIYAPFCPELIAQQTIDAELDDESFTMYVDTLDYSFSMDIILRALPWEESEALIDKMLFDEAEDSMRLQNQVQMRILDSAHG
jgi:hypothetical protein